MSIPLSDLTDRLEAAVPAVDSVPTAAQYAFAVKDAVSAFSIRAGLRRYAEIDVVSGTAAYTLPDDFLKLEELVSLYDSGAWYGNDLVTDRGIIPMNVSSRHEQHTIAGLTITFIPAPQYTATRYMWYKGKHVLVASAYPYMTDEMVPAIMAKATANTYRLIGAQVARSDGWKYSIGDVTIDKTGLGKGASDWVHNYDAEFDRLVAQYVGTVGILSC